MSVLFWSYINLLVGSKDKHRHIGWMLNFAEYAIKSISIRFGMHMHHGWFIQPYHTNCCTAQLIAFAVQFTV